jgi:anti-sigma regulatory factor (Ser/Thr protein kinase)
MTTTIVNPIVKLSIPADVGELRRASAWLDMACRERGVPPDEINRLELCLNEAMANIIDHDCTTIQPFQIRLQLEVPDTKITNEATVTISDSGAPFDPLTTPTKLGPKTLAEAEPGGLGLVMIRSFSDIQHYHYSDGSNHLSFSVRWT